MLREVAFGLAPDCIASPNTFIDNNTHISISIGQHGVNLYQIREDVERKSISLKYVCLDLSVSDTARLREEPATDSGSPGFVHRLGFGGLSGALFSQVSHSSPTSPCSTR